MVEDVVFHVTDSRDPLLDSNIANDGSAASLGQPQRGQELFLYG